MVEYLKARDITVLNDSAAILLDERWESRLISSGLDEPRGNGAILSAPRARTPPIPAAGEE